MVQMNSRTGLDPLELAVLRGLRDVGAVADAPHRKNNHVLDAIEKAEGFGPRYMFDVLCDLSRIWECALPLVHFNGNNGDNGDNGVYPAAPANVTESRLSHAGALALEVDEAKTGALPLRFINGTLYRGGSAPAFEPLRVVECLQRLCAGSQLGNQEIVTTLGPPHFFGDPTVEGDLVGLHAGKSVEYTLSALIAVVGTSARGMTVSVTNFPPTLAPSLLAEELEHHTSIEAWEEFHELVYEDEPRLPIKSVSDRSRGSMTNGHQEVEIKVERGVDIDMFVDALSTHRLVRDELTLAFPRPVPIILRDWVDEYGGEQTKANLAALKELLAG